MAGNGIPPFQVEIRVRDYSQHDPIQVDPINTNGTIPSCFYYLSISPCRIILIDRKKSRFARFRQSLH